MDKPQSLGRHDTIIMIRTEGGKASEAIAALDGGHEQLLQQQLTHATLHVRRHLPCGGGLARGQRFARLARLDASRSDQQARARPPAPTVMRWPRAAPGTRRVFCWPLKVDDGFPATGGPADVS